MVRLQYGRERLARLIVEEAGPTTTEYAVLFTLILLVCVATIGSLGLTVSQKFSDAAQGW